jgi:hypothetical protein
VTVSVDGVDCKTRGKHNDTKHSCHSAFVSTINPVTETATDDADRHT